MSPTIHSDLTFDAETHTYRVAGSVVPSVTQILRAVEIIDGTYYTALRRTVGQYVHEACDLLDRGELDWESLEPGMESQVRAWERFKHEGKVRILESEKFVYDPFHGFAGRLDRIVTINDGPETILDIKTGSPESWHPLQLAGYRLALMRDVLCANLYVGTDSRYRLVTLRDLARHESGFLGALSLFQWKVNYGR